MTFVTGLGTMRMLGRSIVEIEWISFEFETRDL
jgi:hypothetical protein